ncbi:MAG: hypothetical protein ACFFD1_14650, partial [Candidatus Thorarchaeota archaeon]
ILPVIFIARLISKLQIPVEFKIEPTTIILIFAINFIVLNLNFPFPIIVFPGELKLRTIPSKTELGVSIHHGLTLGFLLLIFSSIIVILSNLVFVNSIDNNLLITINMGFLLASLALSIIFLPFANMFGKLARVKPVSYWAMTIITYTIFGIAFTFLIK